MSKENPSQIRIAIVDSGIDASHSGVGEIAGGVQIQIDEKGEVMFSDDYYDCAGHGTACAGIIRKKAPDAMLYSVRIFNESLMADGRALIAAIQWCIDNEMDVVNLSLGTTDVTFKKSLQKVCRKAVDAGVILVAAESNDGNESYPAVFPEVIGVTGGAIYEPDGFYYRKGQRIECVARGDEQRVCWLNGKHIMTGGNSFAAPHITGIVAGLLKQHPKCSVQTVRLLLQEEALREVPQDQNKFKSDRQAHQKDFQEDYAWIKKAVLYPYNKEMHSMMRYRDLLAFEIVGVADPIGKGMVGKDAGKVIGEPVANLRISPNIRRAMADAGTLILGYVDQLARIRKRDLLRDYVQLALDEGCHVFSFQALDPTVYGDLYELADKKGLRLAYPHVHREEITHAIQHFHAFPPVDVPVLSVMGTSSQQGKFTLQLALRRKLIQKGYKVGQIGTEHHSRLFGMDAAFPMGYASPLKLPFQHYIPYLDYKIREICQRTQPDIILTGSQSGTIPYHVQEHSTHCLPTVDEYFLHYSPAYKKRHFVHEILIYGYDNQTFVGIGFDKKGDYAAYPIAFAELEQAVVHADLTGHYDPDGLRLFKYDPQAEYDFDIQLVREHLEDFLYAKNTSQRFRMLANPTDGAYGLATYECLKHFLTSFLSPPSSFDIRPAHILWEHKKCMAYRLKYMEAQGYLKSEYGFSIQYDEVARKIGVLRMMLLKFRKTRSPALIHRMCLHLDAIAEVEKSLLQDLLKELDPVCCESR